MVLRRKKAIRTVLIEALQAGWEIDVSSNVVIRLRKGLWFGREKK